MIKRIYENLDLHARNVMLAEEYDEELQKEHESIFELADEFANLLIDYIKEVLKKTNDYKV